MQTTLFIRQSVQGAESISVPLGAVGVRWVNRTFTVTQLDQQSIGAASDEYEPVPRSFSTQVHSVKEIFKFTYPYFSFDSLILAKHMVQTFFFSRFKIYTIEFLFKIL